MVMVHRIGWDPAFIDRSPWFWPIARVAEALRGFQTWPTHAQLDALYAEQATARSAGLLRFRHHEKVRRGARPIVHESLYDGSICLTGQVPTRPENWHDLLNALCFATWPHTKLALHARQYRLLAERLAGDAQRLPAARTPAQDALTLFDEGGVAVATDPAGAAELRASTGTTFTRTVIALMRARRASVVPFGHAIFEHLVEGIACPGASTRIVACEALPTDRDALLRTVDLALAAKLEDANQFLRPNKVAHLRLEHLAGC